MPSIATATVIGHLYAAPELKSNDRGSYCRIRFWTSDKVRGETEKKFTPWGGIVHGPQAEWLARDGQKGSLVAVTGTVRLDKYTRQDGQESYAIEFTRIQEARILDRTEAGDSEPVVIVDEAPAPKPAPRKQYTPPDDESQPPF